MTNILTVEQAIAQALTEEMRRDQRVITFGEGTATKHHALAAEFGAYRVRNTPLAEGVIAGTAAGAAAMGLRPVIDLLFAPFMTLAMDAIVNSAGKLRYLSGGQFQFPMVVLAMTGAGWTVGGQHNHNLEAMFVHAPGLKVLMPSTPADFYGLLKAAIRDDNPVLMFVDLALLHSSGPVSINDTLPTIGHAKVLRKGRDVTLVSYAKTVGTCLQAADELAGRGIEAEVVDLRSLKPLDQATVLDSLCRTGRLIAVHEAAAPCGLGAELIALASERAFHALKAPPVRLTGPDAPAASSWVLEQAGVPQPKVIVQAAIQLCASVWCEAPSP